MRMKKFVQSLLVVVQLLATASAQDKKKDCLDLIEVPHLWNRYHQQLHDPVPKIHATIGSSDPDCVATDYKMTPELEGAYIDQEGIIHMETKKIIPEKMVDVTAKVGGETITIGRTSIEVFDCLIDFQLVGLESSYKVQKGTDFKPIQLAAKLVQDADNHCRVDRYEIDGQTEQMTIDKRKGIVNVDTSQKLSAKPKIKVVIGSQSYLSESFSIDVFACSDVIVFPLLLSRGYSWQIGSQAEPVTMEATTAEPEVCPITSFQLEGETKGTTIDPETGILTIDTSEQIKKNPRKVSVISGSETIVSPAFEFEVFDCRFEVDFIREFHVQLGQATNTKNIIKQVNRDECKAITQYGIKYPEGATPLEWASVDAATGDLTVDQSAARPKSYISIEIVVGSQTLSYSSKISVEVFDCIATLKFTEGLSVQLGSEKQEILAAVDEDERLGHQEHCKGYFQLTTPEGTTKFDKGISMDIDSGKISVDASKKFAPQTLIVTAKIGIQSRQSEPFVIEVFSCEDGLTHAPNVQAQIGSPNDADQYNFNLLKTKPTHAGCPTDIKYSVKGLTDGVTYEAEGDNMGMVKIDTSKAIDTTVKYTVSIGKQEFKNDLKIEIYDCLPDLQFTKYYQAVLGSETTSVDLLAKNNNEGLCAIESFTSANLPEGITLDEATGKLTFPTDKLVNANLKVVATVGLQTASFNVPLKLYSCQSNMKFRDSLRIQKGTGISKIDFLTLVKNEAAEASESSENQDAAEETDEEAAIAKMREQQAANEILEEMKQARFEVCAISKYSLTQTAEGISIDEKSGQITADSSKLKAETNLQVSVTIDGVVYESEVLSVAVYDCNDQVALPLLMDARQFQKEQKVDMSFAAAISGTDCKVDEYKLVGDMEGVTIDAATGKLNVDTSQARSKTSLVLQLTSGSQTIKSKPFTFEVYDCTGKYSFPNLKGNYVLQKKDGETQEINAVPQFARRECSIDAYAFEGVLEGITVVPDVGKATVDLSKSLAKQSFQVVVTVGTQSITSKKQYLEVYDCDGVFTFMNPVQKIQVDDRTEKSKVVIPVVAENTNKEQCGDIEYSVEGELVPGITLDNGELTIETDKAIAKTPAPLKINLAVGQQKFQTEEMTFEVFDCKPFVTKPEVAAEGYKYQMLAEIPVFDVPFVSSSEDCPIGEYKLSKDIKGMSFPEAGKVVIDREQEIEETEQQIGVVVGTQTIQTEKFTVEVFDCNKHIVFATKQDHQINDAENAVFPIVTSNAKPKDCIITEYKATGLNDLITMDAATGEVTIVTAEEMEKTEVQVSAVVGAQEVSTPKLEYEVYDCSKAMVFAESPRYQVHTNTESWTLNALASNSRPKSCGTYTMTFVDNPAPEMIKMGNENGQLEINVSKELPKTSVQVAIKVGIQELNHVFADIEVFDCIKLLELPELDKRGMGYKFQIDKKDKSLYKIDAGFKSSSDECPIESYSITHQEDGVMFDPKTGVIQFGYEKNIPAAKTRVVVKVGTQYIETKEFIVQVFDCALMVTQPYLWKNHAQQVQGTGYQLQKYLLIDVKPISNDTTVCRISDFDVQGLQPGITFDGERYISVDKDIVTSKIRFDLTVWVGKQVIDLPYVTVLPRKDPFALSPFLIISLALLLLVCLLICILCCLCSRVKKMSAEIEMQAKVNADLEARVTKDGNERKDGDFNDILSAGNSTAGLKGISSYATNNGPANVDEQNVSISQELQNKDHKTVPNTDYHPNKTGSRYTSKVF